MHVAQRKEALKKKKKKNLNAGRGKCKTHFPNAHIMVNIYQF